MKPNFDCLFYMENSSICILEIQRTDLPLDADISQRFQWLIIDIASLKASKLTFRSMDRSDNIEERYFEEGYLKFNLTSGTFIEKFNLAQHQLKILKPSEFPEDYLEVIINTLTSNQ